jgi:hypothetical protein
MANVNKKFERVNRFDRSRLNPRPFYEREFSGQLRRISRSGWVSVTCRFHPDKHPSLRVNTVTGAYRCWACGASGDLVRFVMQTRNCDFRSACEELGCWDHGSQPRRHSRTKPALPVRPQFLSPSERLQQLQAAFDAATRRLDELHAEGRDESPVAEACWRIMAALYPKLRELRGDE